VLAFQTEIEIEVSGIGWGPRSLGTSKPRNLEALRKRSLGAVRRVDNWESHPRADFSCVLLLIRCGVGCCHAMW
jgi:hypothetical protein